MSKSKSKFGIRYTPEFRRQIVELVLAGRKPSELSREFGCTSWSINRWVAQAERDAGRGDDGLTTVEREELVPLLPSFNIRLARMKAHKGRDPGNDNGWPYLIPRNPLPSFRACYIRMRRIVQSMSLSLINPTREN